MVLDFFKGLFSRAESPATVPSSSAIAGPIADGSTTSSSPTPSPASVRPDAEAHTKWIHLIESFVAVWSEYKPKMKVIDDLKDALSNKNMQLKISSEIIDEQAVTLIEIDNLLVFNGVGNHMTTSKLLATSNAVEFLLDFRNLLSNFKKAFYLSQYNREVIVNTLLVQNSKMVQLSTSSPATGLFTSSITIRNVAFFSETGASADATFKLVSFQMCEYLRKIAQIGSTEMMNIFFNKKAPADLKDELESGSTIPQPANGTVSGTSPGANASSPVQKVNSSPIETISVTQSELTDNLIEKWIQLLDHFSTVETSKNCWKIRHELYGKGQRISIHSFEAAALSETTHYATVKVEPNIMRLTEKGKTVELAKNNALCKLMSFLTNLLNLLKDFKLAYSPAESSSAIVHSLMLRKFEIFNVIQKQTSDNQWSTTIELVNIAWFNAVAAGKKTSKRAAAEKMVDLLKKLSRFEQVEAIQIDDGNSAAGAVSSESKSKSSKTKLEKKLSIDNSSDPTLLQPSTPSSAAASANLEQSKLSARVEESHSVSIDDLSQLIARFDRVNTPGKKKLQLLYDLKAEGQPIYFARTSVPSPESNSNNQAKFYVTTLVDIKGIIRVEATAEEIVARKPDALHKAYSFLSNISNLLKDFKQAFTPTKCVVNLLCVLRIRNQKTVDISFDTTNEQCSSSVQFANLVKFTGKGKIAEQCKHKVCAQAVKYLAKLAGLESSTVQVDQCECFTTKQANASKVAKTLKSKESAKGKQQQSNPKSPNNLNTTTKSKLQQSIKESNVNPDGAKPKTNGQAKKTTEQTSKSKSTAPAVTSAQASQPESTASKVESEPKKVVPTESEITIQQRLPLLIQLIDRYNSVKDSDSLWHIFTAMETEGQKICCSLAFTGVNEARVYTYTVDVVNLVAFSASSKDATTCINEAMSKTVQYLGDFLDLSEKFKSLYSGTLPPADLVKNLKKTLKNGKLLKISPISHKSGQYSCTVEILKLVQFCGIGEKSNLAEEMAATKAIQFLLELTQTKLETVENVENCPANKQS